MIETTIEVQIGDSGRSMACACALIQRLKTEYFIGMDVTPGLGGNRNVVMFAKSGTTYSISSDEFNEWFYAKITDKAVFHLKKSTLKLLDQYDQYLIYKDKFE